jgi:hypothetical protein
MAKLADAKPKDSVSEFCFSKTKEIDKNVLTLSPTALGPMGPRVFKGIQLKA